MNMFRVWFTSDTHFGARRTLDLSRRPYSSVEEMDNILVNNMNQFIKPGDLVYHLGDFGNYETIKRLNGNWHLIFGNYEQKDLQDKFGGDIDKFKTYLLGLGFSNISTNCNWYGDILMIHEPEKIQDKSGKTVHLFGHIHEKVKIKPYGLNVGVDCNHFVPIDRDTVYFYKNAIEKGYYDDNVWK